MSTLRRADSFGFLAVVFLGRRRKESFHPAGDSGEAEELNCCYRFRGRFLDKVQWLRIPAYCRTLYFRLIDAITLRPHPMRLAMSVMLISVEVSRWTIR